MKGTEGFVNLFACGTGGLKQENRMFEGCLTTDNVACSL